MGDTIALLCLPHFVRDFLRAMGTQGEDFFDPDGYRRFHAFGPFIDKETFVIMPTTYVSLSSCSDG